MPRIKKPTDSQIRGMLLEEAILFLLNNAGYKIVESSVGDPTLEQDSTGLWAVGRGEKHQIDAIADYLVQQPFINPQRLLLEAKCWGNPTRISVVRNAVGVLKDVSEYWHKGDVTSISKSRYHYSYAIYSASGFTENSQNYAYAQDIYLIPLDNTEYMVEILQSIWDIAPNDDYVKEWLDTDITLANIRQAVRNLLRPDSELPDYHLKTEHARLFQTFIKNCRDIRFALLATIKGKFPVFLIPSKDLNIGELSDKTAVQIKWDTNSWYLYRNEEKIFSFDLPSQLFLSYAEDGILTDKSAIEMKAREMDEIQAVISIDEGIRTIRFVLDRPWLKRISDKLKER